MRHLSFSKGFTLIAILLVIAFVTLVNSATVSAATIYWNGGGSDGKWSTTANWSGSVVPGAGDTALFSTVSTKNAFLNTSTTVGGLRILSNYTGTVSASGGSILTIGTGSYVQGGGTFRGGTGSTVINSSLTLSGGTLKAPSGVLTVRGSFARTGGSFDANNGTLILSSSGSRTITSGNTTLNNVVLSDGLVGYWKLDETSGTTAIDTSGYGNTGTLSAPTPPTISATVAPTNYDNAGSLSFNGTDNYAWAADSSSFQISGAISVSAWIKTSSTAACPIVATRYLGGVAGWFLYIDGASGHAAFDGRDGSGYRDVAGTHVVNDNAWHHLVGEREGSAWRIYVDGALDGQITSGAPNGSINAGVLPVAIGEGAAIGCNDFSGNIDDLRVYNRALSSSEVSGLAAGNEPGTSTDGLVAYWKFDETSGTTVVDSSGNGNTATLSMGPTASAASPSMTFADPRSLQLNGVNDYVQLPDSPSLNITDTITVSAWVKMAFTSVSFGPTIVGRYDGIHGWFLAVDAATGFPYFDGRDGSGYRDVEGTHVVTDNAWHHLVGEREGSTWRIYVDGALDGQITSGSANGSIYPSGTPITIGFSTFNNYFPGLIDDVRIYNRALSSSEVARLYAGHPDAAASSSLTLTDSLAVSGALTINAGLSANGHVLTTTGLATLNAGTYLASTASQTFNGGLTMNGGTFVGSTGTVGVSDLQIRGGTFTAPSGTLFLAGDFTNAGTFNGNGGTIQLTGTNQTLAGSTTFYDLQMTPSTAAAVTFGKGVLQTFHSLTLRGASASAPLTVGSSQGGVQWLLLPAAADLSDLAVRDTKANVDLQCYGCTDGGGNNGIIFVSTAATPTADPGTGGGGGGGGHREISPLPAAPSSAASSSSEAPATPLPLPSLSFSDVPPASWFSSFVSELTLKGIVSGFKDPRGNPTGLFQPGNPVTLAEIAKMALLASGHPLSVGTPRNPSADNDWSSPFIKTAEDLHLSVYTPSLVVQHPATRGEVIQTILEAFGVPVEQNLQNPFSDLPSSDPHAAAILTARTLGIISGDDGKTTVRPEDPINRAETAKIVSMTLKLWRH